MTEPVVTGMRECTACHETKSVLAFGTNRKCRDGISPACRDCRSKQAAERRKTVRNHFIIDHDWNKNTVIRKEAAPQSKTPEVPEFDEAPVVPVAPTIFSYLVDAPSHLTVDEARHLGVHVERRAKG